MNISKEVDLNELFRKLDPLVISVARKNEAYLSRIGMEFEDLCQELRTQVFSNFQKWDSERCAFTTFAMGCMNLFIRNQRSKASKAKPVFSIYEEENDVPILDCLYSEVIIEEEACTRIMAEDILECLSPEDKIIAELYSQGFTMQEIADKLGYSKSTVSRRFKKMKTDMKERGEAA